MKPKILIIVRAYGKSGPQPIRFKNICRYLLSEYDITIIKKSFIKKTIVEYDGLIKIINLPYTRLGRILNSNNQSSEIRSIIKGNKTIVKKIRKYLSIIKLKRIIFPDPFITEIPSLKKSIRSFIQKEHPEIVIGSAFPFSVMILGKYIKRNWSEIKWIFDIGDPFYKNSAMKKRFLHCLFSKYYENHYIGYIDKLIVTNLRTKEHYLKTFPKLNEKKINIVVQGTNLVYNKSIITKICNEFIIVYAGRFYKNLREPFNTWEAVNRYNGKKIKLDIYGKLDNYFMTKLNKINTNGNIEYKGLVDHLKMKEIYQKSNAVLFIDNLYGLQTPGKIYEVLASSKPVLFVYNGKQSPSYEIASKYSNVVMAENEINEIEKAIELLINNYSDIANAIVDLDEYSWENCAKKYIEIINELKNC